VQRLRSPGLAASLAVGAGLALVATPAAAQSTNEGLRSSIAGLSGAAIASSPSPPVAQNLATDPDSLFLGYQPGSGAGSTGFLSWGTTRKKRVRKPGYGLPGATRAGSPGLRPIPQLFRRGAPADLVPAIDLTGPPGLRPIPQPVGRGVPADLVPDADETELMTPVVAPQRRAAVDPAPFDALGVRAGAFLFRPAVEFTAGFDSNPPRATPPHASSEFIVAPELTVNSDWERHALNATIRGSYLWFGESFPISPMSLDRPSLDARASGRIDVTHDDRITVESRLLLSTDNPGSPNIQAGLTRLPVVTTVGGTLGYAHDFNRFEIAVKGTVDRTMYQDSTLTDGTTSSNDDRNFNQYAGILRGSYELLPGVAPFVEADIDTRIHDLKIDRTGADRDSDGRTFRVGTTFHLSDKLTGEASIGETDRTYVDPTLPALKGPVFDASLLYAATALTSVKLTSISNTGELIVPGGSGMLLHDFGLEVDHDFRRWLTGTARLGYGTNSYFGLDRFDNRYLAGVALAYKLTREIVIKGELRHEWMHSTALGVNYDATVALLTVRLQR
jgi:hypothetical protein